MSKVSVYGAIILNEEMNKMIVVKNWRGDN